MEETPSSAQQMAANIFADMVMEEAIKDKTVQVQEQYKDKEGNFIDKTEVDDYIQQQHADKDEDDDFDEEEEKILRTLRERRLEEMKKDYSAQQDDLIKGHGQYQEIVEQEFLPNVTGSKFVICHFYHKDFERCKIVDMHLRQLSKIHPEARFITLDAEKSPFFIQKLQVQVLPTIICFMDGVAVDRMVGFEDVGNRDDFRQVALARRLIRSGCIMPRTAEEKGQSITKQGKRNKKADNESDDEDY